MNVISSKQSLWNDDDDDDDTSDNNSTSIIDSQDAGLIYG